MVRATDKHADRSLHALVVESNFVPEDPANWIEGVRQQAAQTGAASTPEQVKFFIIADAEPRALEAWLKCKDVLGVFLRPVDNRQLLFLLSEHLPNKHTVYNFNNLGWSAPALTVHVSKSVELEALSEFGATLKSPQKMASGTMIYLRKSIFDSAPNECLAARVYACEEHPKEKGLYLVYTTYFGINDGFLKFARTWIRENYATQKSKTE